MLIETFVPKSAIRTFYKSIFYRFSRGNKAASDFVLNRPEAKSLAGKFRAIIYCCYMW